MDGYDAKGVPLWDVYDHLNFVRAIVALLHRTGDGDVDDLVGEGVLGLVLAARRFDPARGFTFKTYAFEYVRGYILAYLSRRRKRLYREWSLWQARARAMPSTDSYPEEPPDETLDLDAVLAKMEPRDQTVLRFRLAGLTQKEMAARLGVGKARVGQLELRAYRRMRQALEEDRP